MISRNIMLLAAAVLCLILSACAPVLSGNYIREGERRVSFAALRQNPAHYKGNLFVFGGVVVETKLMRGGSQIEAMHVPVDRYGYFEERDRSEGRFLAVIPPDGALLDPEVYRKGRRITLAGRFVEIRKAMIGEMEYAYPVFRVEQIHLWPRERRYYPAYYYDPWFYPYPYYYYDPWWRYPYPYYYYYDYGATPPAYRRTRPPVEPSIQKPESPSDQGGDRRLEAPGAPGLPAAPVVPDRRLQRELQRR